jgi:hypothetical protein
MARGIITYKALFATSRYKSKGQTPSWRYTSFLKRPTGLRRNLEAHCVLYSPPLLVEQWQDLAQSSSWVSRRIPESPGKISMLKPRSQTAILINGQGIVCFIQSSAGGSNVQPELSTPFYGLNHKFLKRGLAECSKLNNDLYVNQLSEWQNTWENQLKEENFILAHVFSPWSLGMVDCEPVAR